MHRSDVYNTTHGTNIRVLTLFPPIPTWFSTVAYFSQSQTSLRGKINLSEAGKVSQNVITLTTCYTASIHLQRRYTNKRHKKSSLQQIGVPSSTAATQQRYHSIYQTEEGKTNHNRDRISRVHRIIHCAETSVLWQSYQLRVKDHGNAHPPSSPTQARTSQGFNSNTYKAGSLQDSLIIQHNTTSRSLSSNQEKNTITISSFKGVKGKGRVKKKVLRTLNKNRTWNNRISLSLEFILMAQCYSGEQLAGLRHENLRPNLNQR